VCRVVGIIVSVIFSWSKMIDRAQQADQIGIRNNVKEKIEPWIGKRKIEKLACWNSGILE
jgi:hypothetical protein